MFIMINKLIEKISLILFLNKRFVSIRGRDKKTIIIFNSILWGLTIGLAVLIVVIGVMNGFQESHISRRIEIGSFHISMQRRNGYLTDEDIEAVKNELYKNENVTAVTPFIDKQIIIKSYERPYLEPNVIKLRAFDPQEMAKDQVFMRYLRRYDSSFILDGYDVIIGSELAGKINAGINRYILLTPDISLSSIKNEGIPFRITNIFSTGSYDYDRYWAYISLESLSAISRVYYDRIGIKLYDYSKVKSVIDLINSKYNDEYIIYTAEDMNSGFFNALRIEKGIMSLIFGLIFIMISINTLGAVRFSIMSKKQSIGILKALGAGESDLLFVFILQSVTIGFTASLIGVVSGIFLAYNIESIFKVIEWFLQRFFAFIFFVFERLIGGYPFDPFSIKIYDSTIYYQSAIPVKISCVEVLIMAGFVFFITVFAALFPIYSASKLKPNSIIRDK